jgi:hypothetical protein
MYPSYVIGSATCFGTSQLSSFDSVMTNTTYCPVKKQHRYQPATKKKISSKWQQGSNKTTFSKLPEQGRQNSNSFQD